MNTTTTYRLTDKDREYVAWRRESARQALGHDRAMAIVSELSNDLPESRAIVLDNLSKQEPDSDGAYYWLERLDAIDQFIAPFDLIATDNLHYWKSEAGL